MYDQLERARNMHRSSPYPQQDATMSPRDRIEKARAKLASLPDATSLPKEAQALADAAALLVEEAENAKDDRDNTFRRVNDLEAELNRLLARQKDQRHAGAGLEDIVEDSRQLLDHHADHIEAIREDVERGPAMSESETIRNTTASLLHQTLLQEEPQLSENKIREIMSAIRDVVALRDAGSLGDIAPDDR